MSLKTTYCLKLTDEKEAQFVYDYLKSVVKMDSKIMSIEDDPVIHHILLTMLSKIMSIEDDPIIHHILLTMLSEINGNIHPSVLIIVKKVKYIYPLILTHKHCQIVICRTEGRMSSATFIIPV